ncbi:hypothetical protein SprV_0702363100 [Sparganum proliferum]
MVTNPDIITSVDVKQQTAPVRCYGLLNAVWKFTSIITNGDRRSDRKLAATNRILGPDGCISSRGGRAHFRCALGAARDLRFHLAVADGTAAKL